MQHRTSSLCLVIVTILFGSVGTVSADPLQQAQTLVQPQQQVEAAEKRAADAPNIRVEVVLTDRVEVKAATEERQEAVANERLTFLLADRQLGRLRRHLPNNVDAFNRNFAVDVTPTVLGGRIRLALTVDYQTLLDTNAAASSGKRPPESLEFTQTATLLVESGKPTVVIDATGTPTNRRVTVQATATIVR